MKQATTFPQTGFVRANQIHAPNGPLPISRSTFWAYVKAGTYPRSYKLSPRVTVFKAEDIHALMASVAKGGSDE
jgi:predicted DNA-binding transcriptional regulator AlpA